MGRKGLAEAPVNEQRPADKVREGWPVVGSAGPRARLRAGARAEAALEARQAGAAERPDVVAPRATTPAERPAVARAELAERRRPTCWSSRSSVEMTSPAP